MKRTKKILSIILSICILFSITAGLDFSAYSATLASSGSCGTNVKYTFNSSTGKLVISGTGAMTNYSYSDSSLSSSPFFNQSGIKTVVINSGVTSIGKYAFHACSGLTSVTIGNSVTSIGNDAFSYCTGLTSITIGNGVTSIGRSAFSYCTGLTSITLPDSVISIGEYAFSGCDGLKSVTLGNSVTSIYSYAFSGCTGLTSITIPNSVTSIHSYAFEGCSGLTNIIVDKNNKTYDSRNNCNAIIKTSTNSLIVGCKDTVIPDSVKSIGSDAFEGCALLTSITIPNSVTSIGSFAFAYCTGLTSITIPDSVTRIGDRPFLRCTDLTNIIVDKDNKTYDSRNNCNAIIETSTNSLVAGCKNTIIPDSVTSIGYSAFSGCTGLTSITIPNSVTSIGDDAFYECTNLKELTMPCSAKYNSYSTFFCHNIEKVTITRGTGTMQNYGTDSSSSATNTYYQYTPWYISRNNLKEIVIEDGVNSIGEYAFYYCDGFTNITIPDSLTSVGKDAFRYCTGIKKVNISSLESWCKIAFSNAYGNPLNYAHNLYLNNKLVTDLVIPNSVDKIKFGAFYNCTSLKSVTIPNSVTSISKSAFCYCEGLTSITIPNSVTSIGEYAFNYCKGLTNITISDSVTNIGNYAFQGCENLKDVYYIGSENDWKNVEIGSNNDYLTNATIHYHNHIYKIVDKLDETCLTDGYITYGCECGKEYKEIVDASHEYILLDVIEPDCENDGINIYECEVCGDSYIEEPSALGHDSVIDNVVAPTCTETGLTQGSHCSRCGLVVVKQEIVESYGGHSFTNYISDSNATCLEDGTKTAKCDRCDETNTVTDVDSKLGHSYVATTTKPTCTEGGYTTYNCSRCEDSYVGDYTEALGHTPKVINSVAPTCTETGLTEGNICSVCGVVLIEQQIISANGHSYELYRTTATCEKAGYNIYKCSVCSGTKSEKVDALGHICDSFNGVVDGELNYSCSACGKEYTQLASEIFEKWDSGVFNESAEEFPELDVINDGIINAKDYALLNHIKNYGY